MSDVNATVVRPVHEADRDPWRELWGGYLRFYRAEVSAEVTELTFARLCAGRDGMLGLVATHADRELLGMAHLVLHPSTWSGAGSCYVEDLYVDRARRGTGVATALLHAAYATAAQRGCDRVYWLTQQYNGPARSLYDTLATPTSFVVYEHELTPPAR